VLHIEAGDNFTLTLSIGYYKTFHHVAP